jgi:hypothetical protein
VLPVFGQSLLYQEAVRVDNGNVSVSQAQANLNLSYAQLGESTRQFDASLQAQKDQAAIANSQWEAEFNQAVKDGDWNKAFALWQAQGKATEEQAAGVGLGVQPGDATLDYTTAMEQLRLTEQAQKLSAASGAGVGKTAAPAPSAAFKDVSANMVAQKNAGNTPESILAYGQRMVAQGRITQEELDYVLSVQLGYAKMTPPPDVSNAGPNGTGPAGAQAYANELLRQRDSGQITELEFNQTMDREDLWKWLEQVG